MAIAEDASTPAPKQQTGTTATTTTASFTPPANSLVVALGGAGWAVGAGGNSVTYSVSDSGSHTWTQLAYKQAIHSAGNNAGGTVGVWCCYFTTSPGAITVTGTAGANFGGGQTVCVKVLTGAASTQNGATVSAEFGNPTNATTGSTSITTTTSGSVVYGISDDGQSGSTFTANGSTTNITTPAPAYPWRDTTDIVSLAAWKSAVTGTPGATTLGGTWSSSTQSVLAMAEILPAAGASATISGAASPSGSMTATAVPKPTMSGGVTPGGSLTSTAAGSATISGAALPTGQVAATALPTPTMTGAASPSGSMSAAAVPKPAITGPTTPSGAMATVGLPTISGGISPSGSLTATAVPLANLSGHITPSGSMGFAAPYYFVAVQPGALTINPIASVGTIVGFSEIGVSPAAIESNSTIPGQLAQGVAASTVSQGLSVGNLNGGL